MTGIRSQASVVHGGVSVHCRLKITCSWLGSNSLLPHSCLTPASPPFHCPWLYTFPSVPTVARITNGNEPRLSLSYERQTTHIKHFQPRKQSPFPAFKNAKQIQMGLQIGQPDVCVLPDLKDFMTIAIISSTWFHFRVISDIFTST